MKIKTKQEEEALRHWRQCSRPGSGGHQQWWWCPCSATAVVQGESLPGREQDSWLRQAWTVRGRQGEAAGPARRVRLLQSLQPRQLDEWGRQPVPPLRRAEGPQQAPPHADQRQDQVQRENNKWYTGTVLYWVFKLKFKCAFVLTIFLFAVRQTRLKNYSKLEVLYWCGRLFFNLSDWMYKCKNSISG